MKRPETLGPTAAIEPAAVRPRLHRIVEVDALRGFALCGIFLANVLVMSGLDGLSGGGGSAVPTASGLDQVAHWLVVALVQTKFYLLFSFLFGYSFTLQMDAAERDGAPFAPRMLRRLLGLFVLGALHAVLLYPGDILTTYALLGLILLAARAVDPARMWRAALRVYGVVAALYLLLGAAVALVDTGEGDEGLAASATELATAYRGGPADAVRANMDAWSDILVGLLMMGGMVVAAFLAGFVAGITNYLAQSLVMALVFTGYGAALYGRAGAAAVLGGTLLFYGFQLAASAWLMSRHRLGPVERLLRAVTLWGRPAPRG